MSNAKICRDVIETLEERVLNDVVINNDHVKPAGFYAQISRYDRSGRVETLISQINVFVSSYEAAKDILKLGNADFFVPGVTVKIFAIVIGHFDVEMCSYEF